MMSKLGVLKPGADFLDSKEVILAKLNFGTWLSFLTGKANRSASMVVPARVLPYLLVLIAFALRIYRIDYQSLWWDEGVSLYLATSSIPSILADRASNVHLPLYFLLLRSWIVLVGPSAWAARFLSAVLSTLSVPLLYQLGHRLASSVVGRLAALIIALSPFLIYHAQEARMYALIPFLGLLSTYLLLRLLEGDTDNAASRLLWLAYLVITAAALYTHYYAVFIPFFQILFIFVRVRPYKPFMLRWLLVEGGLLLLYVPWLALAGRRLPASVMGKIKYEQDVSLGLLSFLDRYLRRISLGYLGSSPTLLYAVFILLALLGICHWWRKGLGHKSSLALMLLYLGLPLLGGWLINLRFPFDGFPRLLAFAALPYYLLAAAGLEGLWRRSTLLGGAALVLMMGASGSGLALHYATLGHPEMGLFEMEDYRPLISRVESLAHPRDAVICDFPWQAGYFQSYYRGELPRLYLPPGRAWAADPTCMGRDLDQLMAEHRLIWYPAYQALGGTRGRNIEKYLSREYHLALDEWYGYTRLLLYAGPKVTEEIQHSLEIELGNQIRLLGYSLQAEEVPAGEVLSLTLHWQVLDRIERRHKVFVHLLDAQGQVVGQRDAEPGGGARPTITWRVGEALADNYGVLVPSHVPPGEYQIEVGMYDLETMQRLPAFDEQGTRLPSDRILLGKVRVD